MTQEKRPVVLFLCTHNSCRSQMAEGWLRHLAGDRFEATSAGLEPYEVHPLAVAAMKDAGIDIRGQRSKGVSELLGRKMIAYAVFVCAAAEKNCPAIYPFNAKRLSWPFEDPAGYEGSEADRYCKFVEVRDLIGKKIRKWLEELDTKGCDGKQERPTTEQNQKIHEAVREGYARIAEETSKSCCGPSSCCKGDGADAAAQLAQSLGYGADDLAGLPEGANMGLSCGNPVALASLREGEVVLDLGSGGGFDVFIAGRQVGETGRTIGVDMTPEMIAKARRNTAAYREQTGLDNVEFRLGEIEHLPVGDASVDAVISNCVINLSPDKPQVWREIARVLKPGGRVSVSDTALLKPLPEAAKASVEALVGCVTGAVLVDETREMVRAAGLADMDFECKSGYIESLTDWSDPVYRELAGHLPPGTKPSDFVTSLSVTARKP